MSNFVTSSISVLEVAALVK